MQQEQKPLPKLLVAINTINPKIFPATKYVEPRVCNIVAVVTDEKGAPIEDCKVSYRCGMGVIDPHSYRTTDKNGLALASYYSFKTGRDIFVVKVEKEGFEPAEAEAVVEVVETATPVKIMNNIERGEIFVNGEKIGVGKAEKIITVPGIYVISWGKVDGYETPEPVRLYVNPNFSVEPMTVEGKYVAQDEKREFVEVTVFVCITLDDHSGVPNPVPEALVFLSDGQSGVTDNAGFAKFKVKAGSGPLKIRAKHPRLYENYQEAEVNVGYKDLHVNLDFGIFFGGESVVGLEI
ncbi:MAG: hypothetical protein QXF45_05535 [Candidatus Caldarchaeum sp.]